MIKLFIRFFFAFVRSAYWKARGWEILTSHEGQRLRDITCLQCGYRKEDICSLCGCPLISKTILAPEECPKKYWRREKVAKK